MHNPLNQLSVPIYNCSELCQAERKLVLPFALRRKDGTPLIVETMLRHLPGKRIAAQARQGSDAVFAKLFIGPHHARRCQREVAGLQLLTEAGQPTPAVITTEALDGGHLILSTFITNARSVAQRWRPLARRPAGDPVAVAVLAPMFRQLGALHRAGLTHEDVHPGNFLMAGNRLYVLDGEAIRRAGPDPVDRAEALRNLGMLRAQLPMDWDDPNVCAPLLHAYREGYLSPTVDTAPAPTPFVVDHVVVPTFLPHVFLRPLEAETGPTVSPGRAQENTESSQVFLPLEERNERRAFFGGDSEEDGNSGLDTALQAATDRAREVRLTDYLRKIRRDCTLFQVDRRPGQFSVVLREYADALAPVLADPDAWVGRGTMLKNGRSATVVRITLDAAPLSTAGDSALPHHACPTADPTLSSPATSSQTSMPGGATSSPLVLKRYNLKSGLHALSRALRPSRAWHAWCAGHRLRLLGIPTPTPLAIIEERSGPLRGRAWLITEWCEGTRLIEHFGHDGARAPNEAEARALTALFTSLRRARITHGDLKAHNLFWQDGRLALIDLDAMVHHNRATADARAWHKDRARFLRNWPENSPLHRWLDTALPTERL